MKEALLVGVPLVALLAWEWRSRHRAIRIAATVVAVILLTYSQPSPYVAWRMAMGTPVEERETHYPSAIPGDQGRPLSEFESGVFAMHAAINEQASYFAWTRRLSLVALIWLALVPAIRKERPSRREGGAPEA